MADQGFKTSSVRNLSSPSGKLTVRGYITAFVDLLGVRRSLREADAAADQKDRRALGKNLLLVSSQIRTFRQEFYAYNEELASILESRKGSKRRTDDETERWERLRPMNALVQSFSDSIVVSVPFDADRPLTFYAGLYSLLMGCAGACVSMLGLYNVPVRGGVALGYGVDLGSGEVVGTGLLRAYDLENVKGAPPRIVIDEQLLTDATHPKAMFPAWRPTELVQAENALRKMVLLVGTDSTDEKSFIDYLNPRTFELLRNAGAKETYLRKLVSGIDTAVASGLRKHDAHTAVHAKWHWLDRYWGTNRAEVLDVVSSIGAEA